MGRLRNYFPWETLSPKMMSVDRADVSIPSPREYESLSLNGCKARYGVAYVRAVCGQAGVGFSETSPDEDVLAVDGQIEFGISPVRLQIKCSSTAKFNKESTSWHLKPEWRKKWSQSRIPVYFVVVILGASRRKSWVSYNSSDTLHHASAFWVRIDTERPPSRVYIPRQQQLSVETIGLWHREASECFSQQGGVADVG